MKDKYQFGSLIRLARKKAGLTQHQLAQRANTKQPAIARAENGNIGSLNFVERLIKACGFRLRLNHVTIQKGGKESVSLFNP